MTDPITPNLGLTLPVVGGTVDPVWANEINVDMQRIDALVYSPAQPVGGSGSIDISADVSFNGYNATGLRAIRVNNASSSYAGSADKLEFYAVNGDAYYNNAAGVPVRLTNGPTVNASGSNSTFGQFVVTSNLALPANSTYSTLLINTTANRTITLPAASTAGGRRWTFYDVSGDAASHPVTFVPNGSDTVAGLNAGLVVSQPYFGISLESDGASGWWEVATQLDKVGGTVTYVSGSTLVVSGTLATDAVQAATVGGHLNFNAPPSPTDPFPTLLAQLQSPQGVFNTQVGFFGIVSAYASANNTTAQVTAATITVPSGSALGGMVMYSAKNLTTKQNATAGSAWITATNNSGVGVIAASTSPLSPTETYINNGSPVADTLGPIICTGSGNDLLVQVANHATGYNADWFLTIFYQLN